MVDISISVDMGRYIHDIKNIDMYRYMCRYVYRYTHVVSAISISITPFISRGHLPYQAKERVISRHMASDEDDWSLDYTEARVRKIKTRKINELKETCDGLPDEKKRLTAGLKDIDAEAEKRMRGVPENVKKREAAEKKRKRQAAAVANGGGAAGARWTGGAQPDGPRPAKKAKAEQNEPPWHQRCEQKPVDTWNCFSDGYAVLQHAVGYGRPLASGVMPSGNGNVGGAHFDDPEKNVYGGWSVVKMWTIAPIVEAHAFARRAV